MEPANCTLGLPQWDCNDAACHATTGDMDYLLRVHVGDLPHFSRFVMDSLLEHPGVIDVKSSFVLERAKETTALPVAPAGR